MIPCTHQNSIAADQIREVAPVCLWF